MYAWNLLFAPGPPPPPPPAKPAPAPPPTPEEARQTLDMLIKGTEADCEKLAKAASGALTRARTLPPHSMQRRQEEAAAVDHYRRLKRMQLDLAAMRQKCDMLDNIQRTIARNQADVAVAHSIRAAAEQMRDVPVFDLADSLRDLEERDQLLQRSFAMPAYDDINEQDIERDLERLQSEGYDAGPLPDVAMPAAVVPAAPPAAEKLPVHSK